MTPFLGHRELLYKIWPQDDFWNIEFYIISKLRNLEIREHSNFSIIEKKYLKIKIVFLAISIHKNLNCLVSIITSDNLVIFRNFKVDLNKQFRE